MAAIFPAAVATPLQMLTALNNTKVTLNVNAAIGDTTLTVDDASPLPVSGFVTFADNDANPETISYTGKSGNNLTGLSRGADGTAAAAHVVGAAMEMRWNAAYHNTLATELIAVEQNISDRFGTGTNILVPGTRTFTLAATTNQIVLGVTNTTTITAPAPAASRVYTVPDAGGAASFVMTQGTQTIVGALTLSAAPTLSALTATTVPYLNASKVLTSSAVTPTELGYLSGVTSAIQAQITNATLQNALDNGGFEGYGWQRGTTFSAPANASYGADRWRFDNSEATNVTVTKETTTIDSVGLSSMKVVVTSAGASKTWYITEQIENYADYRGKTVTLSARVFSSVASSCRVQIYDGVTTTTSSYHTGGGGWETLSVTATIGAAITQIQLQIGMVASGDKKNGTYYFDSAMLILGSGPAVFAPIDPQVDKARCQEFCQVIGGALNYVGMGQCLTTTGGQWIYPLKVTMRAASTAVVNNQTSFSASTAGGATPPLTALSLGDASVDAVRLNFTIGAASLVAGNASNMTVNNVNGTVVLSADL